VVEALEQGTMDRVRAMAPTEMTHLTDTTHPTHTTAPTQEAIERAVRILRGGGLVAMPTETVYGLAADAANPEAIARLYEAKGRPRFNPLIAHVGSLEQARAIARLGSAGEALGARFWPGPLTLVAPVVAGTPVCDLARAGLETVAVRIPDHPVALALLAAFGGPLAAPSANPSGRISPTEAEHVVRDLGDRVDLVLDGGRCARGIESTIVDVSGEAVALLRPGALASEEIEAVVGPLARPAANPAAPSAPGQLLRHYAPRAVLRLEVDVNASAHASAHANAKTNEGADENAPRSGEALLGFGGTPGATLDLSPTGDLREAAANLFGMLRALDAEYDAIAVVPIPRRGLGEAIRDRLERASQRE
jgi:L-threonylcarbamoyladenylate synthase